MEQNKADELTAFLREHRSSETNFDALLARLHDAKDLPNYESVEDKAETYKKAKETGGTAWPEFEKFVTEFERAVLNGAGSAS